MAICRPCRKSCGCAAGYTYRTELVETEGWLKFIVIADLLPSKQLDHLRDECSQLCRVLNSSVATSKGRKL